MFASHLKELEMNTQRKKKSRSTIHVIPDSFPQIYSFPKLISKINSVDQNVIQRILYKNIDLQNI